MTVIIGALVVIAYILPVALFSLLAFWKPNAMLFMVTAGVAMMVGLYWPSVDGDLNLQLGIGIMLVAYSFICIAYAYRMLFYREGED